MPHLHVCKLRQRSLSQYFSFFWVERRDGILDAGSVCIARPRFPRYRLMSAVPKYLPRYTVDDYAAWEGDWELWDGIAVSMSPSPFGNHQLVLFNLARELGTQLLGQQCDAVVLGEIDWIVSRETVVRPDVVVLCGAAPEKHIESAPSFVAEIVSPSSAERDRIYKRDLYDREGVGTYLIVEPESKSITAYVRDENGRWVEQSIVNAIEFKICDDCSATVQLADLF